MLMKFLLKISVYILTIFALTVFTQSAQCKVIKKDIEIQTKDSRIIKAKFIFENSNAKKKYPVVVLLHSIGYSSLDWGGLIPSLNNTGYAVLAIDLRGHGQSVYDKTFHKKSWTYFTNKTYQKFPSDVNEILKQTQTQIKMADMTNFAIIGADIGANTAILAAKDMKIKPKTIILISPTENFKGMYIPVAMTELEMPILSMTSTKDRYCLQAQKKLARFSQGGFYAQNYPNGGMGMLMIKVNPSMSKDITNWIKKYLK